MHTIRLAKTDEHQAVAAVVNAAYSKWIEVIGRKPLPMLADYQKLIGDGVVYVIAPEDEIIAVLVIWRLEDAFWIENICVHPGQQSGGLGRALMDFAEMKAHEANLKRMGLLTHAKFDVNIAYYLRLGYVETRREPMSDGGQVVYMHKILA